MKKHRKKMPLITIFLSTIALVMVIVLIFVKYKIDNDSDIITRAEAAKMVAGAAAPDISALKSGKSWYDKYVSYVNENGYMKIKKPNEKLTYGDVKVLLNFTGKTFGDVGIEEKSDKSIIKKNDFVNLYIDILPVLAPDSKVETIEAGIIGTPSNIKDAGAWQVYTTKGVYNFEGLILDKAIDKTASLIVKEHNILCVQRIVNDSVTYKNVWIEEGKSNSLKAFVYGARREFKVDHLEKEVNGTLADIHIQDKKVTGVDIKTDTIRGKVLSVTEEYMEIEGYGRVPLDQDYKIYNNYNGLSLKSYKDIVVGYSLQDFIVADGKICGAVISQPLNADTIRVLIKTDNFKSLFHNLVSVTSDNSFTLYFGDDKEEKHPAGEVISFDKNSSYLSEGRVRIKADADAPVTIKSVTRNQNKNPSYEGSIEISVNNEGLLITNEVPIEKYLKRVVPSEMPVKYGVEALKVQAVCARSYAYKQLTNNHYSAYGAHVDDSTQYQVYNNIEEYPASNQAISETDGEVITYNNEVVQAYYFSTSCGYTTDVSLWGTDPARYPYFTAHSVNQDNNVQNLSNEAEFTAFIKNTSSKDYEKDFPLYRWKWNLTVKQLSDSFNSKLGDRYKAYPQNILTKSPQGVYESKEISSVGSIKNIKVETRVAGGAAKIIIVEGSDATVKIDGESSIRFLLGVADQPLTTATGDLKSMANLPSTFCIFEQVYNNNELTGFQIIGGGYGHGIGMSQNAVYAMTNKNMNYKAVIQYFYKNIEIKKSNSVS